MFRRFDGGDRICASQGCSCLVGFGTVAREVLHRKGATKRIKRKCKEINNFEARRHRTLRKKGANLVILISD
jgi:hypothetical protein